MSRYKYPLIGVSVTLLVTFIVGSYLYQQRENDLANELSKKFSEALERPYSPTTGPDNAPVTIVEFLDPECEACKGFSPSVKQVLAQFDGRVRLVVRHLPFHPNSAYAIRMLHAARKQGKYWEALQVMFDRQPDWASHHAPKPELLIGYMKDIGLDIEPLKAAMDDSEAQSKLRQDQEDGNHLNVTRTPTFFINGKRLNQLGYNELVAAVTTALAAK